MDQTERRAVLHPKKSQIDKQYPVRSSPEFPAFSLYLCLAIAASFYPVRIARADVTFPSDANVITVKNAPYYDAGNGTTDDTAAVQAAVSNAGQGQIVYLPSGTYL